MKLKNNPISFFFFETQKMENITPPEKKIENYKTNNIKDLATEDRPREKMMLKGKEALSNAELLAILIGSGNATENAVELCRRILKELANNNLEELTNKTIEELIQFKGIGEAKAISIMAALELGKRRQAAPIQEKPQIKSSYDAFILLQPYMADLPHEEFWILYLNNANRVLSHEKISSGGINAVITDLRLIFKKIIDKRATGIVVAHNHPSGSLQPSNADIQITQKLKEAAKIFDITLFDHLIITNKHYYSFADEGII